MRPHERAVPGLGYLLLLCILLGCNGANMSKPIFDRADDNEMARAVSTGDLSKARGLIDSGRVDPLTIGRERSGWLAIAVASEEWEMMEYLLSAGALGPADGPLAGQAMYFATTRDDPKWLERLRRAGASLDNRGGGELLVQVAANTKNPAILDYYIEQGADLSGVNTLHDPVIVACAMSGNYPAVQRLLDAGVSAWSSSADGTTIGFWLERVASRRAWDRTSTAERERQAIIARLRAAGVPHPPPSPDEVKALREAGRWPPG